MFLIAPGPYLPVKWFVITPVIVIEGIGVFGSFRRSMDLVSGSWCYVFCTQIIVATFMGIATIVWTVIFNADGTAVYNPFQAMLSLIPNIIVHPILAIAMTIMYINLRVEK